MSLPHGWGDGEQQRQEQQQQEEVHGAVAGWSDEASHLSHHNHHQQQQQRGIQSYHQQQQEQQDGSQARQHYHHQQQQRQEGHLQQDLVHQSQADPGEHVQEGKQRARIAEEWLEIAAPQAVAKAAAAGLLIPAGLRVGRSAKEDVSWGGSLGGGQPRQQWLGQRGEAPLGAGEAMAIGIAAEEEASPAAAAVAAAGVTAEGTGGRRGRKEAVEPAEAAHAADADTGGAVGEAEGSAGGRQRGRIAEEWLEIAAPQAVAKAAAAGLLIPAQRSRQKSLKEGELWGGSLGGGQGKQQWLERKGSEEPAVAEAAGASAAEESEKVMQGEATRAAMTGGKVVAGGEEHLKPAVTTAAGEAQTFKEEGGVVAAAAPQVCSVSSRMAQEEQQQQQEELGNVAMVYGRPKTVVAAALASEDVAEEGRHRPHLQHSGSGSVFGSSRSTSTCKASDSSSSSNSQNNRSSTNSRSIGSTGSTNSSTSSGASSVSEEQLLQLELVLPGGVAGTAVRHLSEEGQPILVSIRMALVHTDLIITFTGTPYQLCHRLQT